MNKKKILIIDDEEDFCLLLRSFFLNKEVEVIVAHTLSIGLDSIKKHCPDILFLDNNLPDGLGWGEVPSIIKDYPLLELNLISAYDNKEFNYLQGYPVKFWEKPLNIAELNKYATTL